MSSSSSPPTVPPVLPSPSSFLSRSSFSSSSSRYSSPPKLHYNKSLKSAKFQHLLPGSHILSPNASPDFPPRPPSAPRRPPLHSPSAPPSFLPPHHSRHAPAPPSFLSSSPLSSRTYALVIPSPSVVPSSPTPVSAAAAAQAAALRHTLPGTFSAVLSMCLVYPLDNLRTRLAVNPRKAQQGLLAAAEDVRQREGVGGLYRGIGSSIVGVCVSWAVYYYLYTFVKFYRRGRGRSSSLEHLLSGLVAGVVAAVVSNPLWVALTRQQLSPLSQRGLFHTLWKIARMEGLSGLFSGLLPSLCLVINPAIQFTAYEAMKQMLFTRKLEALRRQRQLEISRHDGIPSHNYLVQKGETLPQLMHPLRLEEQISTSGQEYFVLGLISKLLATVITYPYQVVTARAQAPFAAPQYSGTSSASLRSLVSIVDNEGLRGLYKGFKAKILMTVLTSGIMFMTYENSVKLIGDIERRRTVYRQRMDLERRPVTK